MINVATFKRRALVLANLEAPSSDGERRMARIAQATLTAVLTRGVSAAVAMFSVPLALRYLGAERNGVWVTITTIFAGLGVADLGFGYSVMNALSKAFAHDDREGARRAISSALAMLCGIGLLLLAIMVPVSLGIDWSATLNAPGTASSEITTAVLAMWLVLAAFLPLNVLPKVFAAYQEGHVANYVMLAGSLLGFAGLVLAVTMKASLGAFVLLVHGAQIVVWLGAAVWLFMHAKPWMRPSPRWVSRSTVSELWSQGWKFFILQLAGVANLQADSFIIARRVGAEDVTPFNNAQKLFLLASLIQLVAFPYVWTAFAEASAKGHFTWMRKALRRGTIAILLLAAGLAIPLALVAQPFIGWLMGVGDHVVPSTAMVWWFCAWVLVSSATLMPAGVLNASGRLNGQLVYVTITAVVNVLLSFWWAPIYGATGVIAASVVAYLCCNIVPYWVEVTRLIRERAGAGLQPHIA